jgi:type II secretory pathway pseudopilin PulG
MIVLAIAGLIMAIVFLAIPALQRNNRNTQRKNDITRLAGQINDYISNNNGKLPTSLVFSGTVPTPTATVRPLDLTKENYSILDTTTNTTLSFTTLTGNLTSTGTANAVSTPPGTATGNSAPPKPDVAFLYSSANCAGGNVPQFTQSKRAFVIWYGIEGTTTEQCIEG